MWIMASTPPRGGNLLVPHNLILGVTNRLKIYSQVFFIFFYFFLRRRKSLMFLNYKTNI